MSMVRFKQGELPPMTEERKAELKALSEMSDSEIDYSDIPALTDTFWENAVRGKFYRPTKTHTSVRIDSDVMLWLKSKGKGYQTRLNEILRRAMIEEIDEAHGH
jgi:uncharacterized protein (DUF4415 family)